MHQNQTGYVLPFVMIICTLLSFCCYLALSQTIRFRQSSILQTEFATVRYAAESGIYIMQSQLLKNHAVKRLVMQQNGKQIIAQVMNGTHSLMIYSHALGKWRVQYTIQGELDPQTLRLKRWIKQKSPR
ncbi:hypothetical protein SAMN05444392_102157 [Seinonella peptonophila]|uniref:Competence protein ComGG n=1 Tax=Seinonella peptonophila TaxID=112248 RepID=A0A1M4V466_9BACL|nr:hypothetical protein [Seinonella peptonophila]SHE63690.1 hypothetical protein SAMN05444392_102157 [Seinonella peptonophila]